MALSLISYVLRAAVRDRLILSVFILLALATSLSIFMGSSVVTETDQFAAVFAAGSIRILNVFGLSMFIVFFIRRSFDSRDIEFLLTRPVGRIQFLLSYAAAFIIIGMLVAGFSALCLYALSPHLFGSGHILWALSMVMENMIMACTALFFAMVLTSPALAMFATLGFYILGRMMSHLLGIADSNKLDGKIFENLEALLEIISMVMPRLDLMGQTHWLIYDIDPQTGFGFIVLQGTIYTALIISASVLDLVLRRF